MTHDISGPDGRGLDNIAIFDLVLFERKWGRWGVGPVVQFFPAERSGIGELLGGRFANIIPFFPRVGSDIDTTVAGPAAGFVVRSGNWNLGLFNQNYFGGNTRFSTVQPIVAYDFGAGWTVEAGEAQWGVDWKRRQFVNIPVGIQVGKVVAIAGQPVRFFVNPEYNARNITGAPHWLIRSGFAILAPAGPR